MSGIWLAADLYTGSGTGTLSDPLDQVYEGTAQENSQKCTCTVNENILYFSGASDGIALMQLVGCGIQHTEGKGGRSPEAAEQRVCTPIGAEAQCKIDDKVSHFPYQTGVSSQVGVGDLRQRHIPPEGQQPPEKAVTDPYGVHTALTGEHENSNSTSDRQEQGQKAAENIAVHEGAHPFLF